jgi:4-hydroxy-tetrahydrodipicolinate reductase
MKIALIGYGKMGHMIEQVALLRGHEIVCTIDINEENKFASEAFRSADVAIEFTTPQTAETNVRRAWEQGVPVVCGTTGWKPEALRIKNYELKIEDNKVIAVENGKVMLVWSSNFSVGVNILFDLNKWLAEKLREYPQYHPHIYEEHHIHKLDKPSGTAKTLAEQIVESQEDVQGDNVQGTKGQELKVESIPIESVREGEIPGNHSVIWDSPEDTIVISHMAKGREGFALGAVIAAEKIMNNE